MTKTYKTLLLLNSLTIYRGILDRGVIKSYMDLLSGINLPPEEFLSAYGSFYKLLTERANKDYLTKLYNRNYTMDKIKDAFADGQLYYIAMIDIDNFKRINDTYGHSAGDVVLKKVASVMETVCSDSTVARWGGEEFLILSLTGPELIEKLRDEIENTPVEFEDQKIKVTVTAGVSSREGFGSVDKWIIAADEKLYYGKNNGKNRVVT